MNQPFKEYQNPKSLTQIPPGYSSGSRFEQVLRKGYFAITSELAPPDTVDPEKVYEEAELFDGYVDAINATDGSGANCHMSSVTVCALLSKKGYSPIVQFSSRDRNRIAIQADILGVAAMNVGNVLALTGDGVLAGDHPEAKPVFDFDSISLLQTMRIMRDESRFLSGRKIEASPKLFIGSTINPFVPPVKDRVLQLAKKINAGAQFIQSQYCFDIPMLKDFMAQVIDLGLDKKCFILPGVGLLPSARTAKWLRNNIPGVHIPDDILKRIEGAKDQKQEGVKICVEQMQQIKEIKGVSGLHIMAYKQEKHIGELVEKSNVLDGREPWSLKNNK